VGRVPYRFQLTFNFASILCHPLLSAVKTGHEVTVNLGKVDHLDASALQILLALDAEQQRQGRHLKLANASPHLRQWFEYAGATEHLSMTDSKNDD